jgi:aromatic ring-opening dioxygenase LigB subunit
MSKLAKSKAANCDLGKTIVKSVDSVKQQILVIRGHRVMLDRDLAILYGVTTKRLNQQFSRNRHRFPKDFAFRLTLAEAKSVSALRLQNATLKRGQHIKHAPHVFTEHGAIMLASVLNSPVAVQASVYVVRAFVQMRTALMEYAGLSRRIDELAATYDYRFQKVFDAIRALMMLPTKQQRSIGFVGFPPRSKRKKDR